MIPIAIYAESAWDPYTLPATLPDGTAIPNPWQQWMRYRPDMVIGWSPYQNPNLGVYPKLLAYLDTYAIYNHTPLKNTDPAVTHPEWILHDDKGNKLFIPWGCANGTCPQFAGDLTNPGFQKDQMARIAALEQQGYQGVFLDDVNLALTVSDGTSTIVAPRGVTPESWARAVVQFLEQVRTSFPNLILVHNAVWFASVPADLLGRQIRACNFYNLERGYGDGSLTPLQMARQREFVARVHLYGRNVIQMEYSQNPIAPSTMPLADKLAWFQLGYKPGDLLVVEDLFPDGDWSLLDGWKLQDGGGV